MQCMHLTCSVPGYANTPWKFWMYLCSSYFNAIVQIGMYLGCVNIIVQVLCLPVFLFSKYAMWLSKMTCLLGVLVFRYSQLQPWISFLSCFQHHYTDFISGTTGSGGAIGGIFSQIFSCPPPLFVSPLHPRKIQMC